jgi:hypothetical protein
MICHTCQTPHGQLDKNWEAVHNAAMTPIREAIGNPEATVPEIVEAITEARQAAEQAQADAAAMRVVLELAHAFILAVHEEFNFDTKTYSCQIREQVEAYLTTDDGTQLIEELKLLRYACQMYVDYRGMFIADFQAKYDIQDDFTGHVLDTMRAALRKEPT